MKTFLYIILLFSLIGCSPKKEHQFIEVNDCSTFSSIKIYDEKGTLMVELRCNPTVNHSTNEEIFNKLSFPSYYNAYKTLKTDENTPLFKELE